MNQVQKMDRSRESACGNVSLIFAYVLFLAFAVSIVTPERLFADEQSHRKLAEEYMVLTDTAKMMTGAFDQLKAKQLANLDKVDYAGKSPEKDKELKKRVADYLDKKLSWSNFREGYIDVYGEAFTEEELKALVAFYTSPVGQKVLNTTQDVRMKLLQATQAQLTDMMVTIRKMEQDFVTEQEKQKE